MVDDTDLTPHNEEVKVAPSVLYTTEAEESKKKTEEELEVPDPEQTLAELLEESE